MSFSELKLKKSYDSDIDDILDEFYIPVLSKSVKYQRLAGFFSSSVLAVAAKGIIGLINNGGTMQLVCGAKLQEEDVQEILRSTSQIENGLEKVLLRELEEPFINEDIFVHRHVEALGWISGQRMPRT